LQEGFFKNVPPEDRVVEKIDLTITVERVKIIDI